MGGGGGGRAPGVELCSASCCACRGTREGAGKRKREREKRRRGKRGTGEKGRKRGGCVGGIHGDGRESAVRRARLSTRGRCVGGIRGDGRGRGVEHAARRGGRGKEKGWRLISDARRRKVEKRFGRLGARTVSV
jgi:hypothetical protein